MSDLSVAWNKLIESAIRSTELPADWCEKNLRFDEPNNQGPYTLIGREYAREPLNSFGDRAISDQCFVFGSQAGKSVIIMGGSAWSMVNETTSCANVWPNTEKGLEFSETRWCKMLEASPGTRDLIPTGRHRHQFKNRRQMLGGSIYSFFGSNSPANIAGTPCDRTICDETDKFADATKKETDAVYLVDQRTKAAKRPQRTKSSTPTLETGRIWQTLLKSDYRRRWLPCPHCGKLVVFVWDKHKTCLPITGAEAEMTWDEEARRPERLPGSGAGAVWDLDRVARSARMICPHCAEGIEERHKFAMDIKGIWRPSQPAAPGRAGWHLSSLYVNQPETTFGALALKFLETKYDIGAQMRGFYNGELAEPDINQDSRRQRIEVITESIDASEPKPEERICLMSADVQQRSPNFWVGVREFDGGNSLGLLGHEVNDWEELDDIQKQYQVENHHVIIDSGWGAKTLAKVYQECAKRCEIIETNEGLEFFGWIPAKGQPDRRYWRDKETGLLMPWKTTVTDPWGGTSWANRAVIKLLEFSGSNFKDLLEDLRNGETGYTWAVHPDIGRGQRTLGKEAAMTATELYWEHLDSEEKAERWNKLKSKPEYDWGLRYSGAPNHLLDVEVQLLVLASYLELFPADKLAEGENHEEHKEHEE